VDPMSDKYPSWSPFTYCLNNPVRLIDPNGCESDEPINLINIKNDKINDGALKTENDNLSDNISNSNTFNGNQEPQRSKGDEPKGKKSVEGIVRDVLSKPAGEKLTGSDIAKIDPFYSKASSMIKEIKNTKIGIEVNLTWFARQLISYKGFDIPSGSIFIVQNFTDSKGNQGLKITSLDAKINGNPFLLYLQGNNYSLFGNIFGPIF